VVVDHQFRDRSAETALIQGKTTDADAATSRTACGAALQLDLAAKAEPLAIVLRDKAIASSLKKMQRVLGTELDRMRSLAARHGHLDPAEIASLETQQSALDKAIRHARLRVDAVRVAIAR
jgi:hypothetical protein